MRNISSLFCLLLFITSSAIHADTILLLHGYLGSSYEWQRSGIVGQLDSADWQNAGVLVLKKERVFSSKELNSDNYNHMRRFYSLELASEQPIEQQAGQLDQYVKYVRYHHPEEQIILIGHSAGGVVARFYMVKNPSEDLGALVTIASPHLGTKNAEYAQSISENLLVWVDRIPGVEKLYRSQGLYFDLIPGRTDNLIA
ncbi:MAG: alpha/beta fold hydrolase [Gammaproteobacteria bacterium]